MNDAKLQRLGEKGNYKKLEKYTSDKSAEVRAAAYEALGLIDKSESIILLNSGIRDASPEVRLAAANALKKVGKESMLEPLKLQRGKETELTVQTAMDEALAAIKSRL